MVKKIKKKKKKNKCDSKDSLSVLNIMWGSYWQMKLSLGKVFGRWKLLLRSVSSLGQLLRERSSLWINLCC